MNSGLFGQEGMPENLSKRQCAFTDAFTVFRNSGSFTVPAGIFSVAVIAWGGGAGGRSTTSTQAGSGGGGGGVTSRIFSVSPGQVFSFTVGAGGASNTAGGTTSVTAPDTTVISATGGSTGGVVSGSACGTITTTGGAGGTGSGGIGFPAAMAPGNLSGYSSLGASSVAGTPITYSSTNGGLSREVVFITHLMLGAFGGVIGATAGGAAPTNSFGAGGAGGRQGGAGGAGAAGAVLFVY